MLHTVRRLLSLLALLGVVGGLSGCAAAPAGAPAASGGEDLVVFAAASLTDAFGEAAAAFEAAHPGATVTFNFAGSQQLAQQLAQGAPADVFASANQKQMDGVVASARVAEGAAQTLVRNRLVVIYPQDNPAQIMALQDLAKPGLKLVLAAPEVPVGGYSLDFLAKASTEVDFGAVYSPTVLANVVSYEESVRAVLSKVALGEADAGIVYTSDVVGDAAAQVGQLAIPDALNTIATYPIAVVADSHLPDLAREFVDFLRGPAGQAILQRYGFVPAATTAP